MTSTPSMIMAEVSAQTQGPSVVSVKADLSQPAWASQGTQAVEEEVCLRGSGGPDGPILDSGGGRWQGLAEQCQPRAPHLSTGLVSSPISGSPLAGEQHPCLYWEYITGMQ